MRLFPPGCAPIFAKIGAHPGGKRAGVMKRARERDRKEEKAREEERHGENERVRGSE